MVQGEVVVCSDGSRRDHNENSARCEIQSQGATPKLGRCSLNVDTIRAIVGVVSPGVICSDAAGGAPAGMV